MCFWGLALSLGAKEAAESMGGDLEKNIQMASQLQKAMEEANGGGAAKTFASSAELQKAMEEGHGADP